MRASLGMRVGFAGNINVCESTATPYERWGERNDARGKEDDVGVTVQEEHDGLEEDRSDPEGRGAHGPARPT